MNLSALGKIFAVDSLLWQCHLVELVLWRSGWMPGDIRSYRGISGGMCCPALCVPSLWVTQELADCSLWSLGGLAVLLCHHSVPGRGIGACSDSWPFLPFLMVPRTPQLLSHGHKGRRTMGVWLWSLWDRLQPCFSLKNKGWEGFVIEMSLVREGNFPG